MDKKKIVLHSYATPVKKRTFPASPAEPATLCVNVKSDQEMKLPAITLRREIALRSKIKGKSCSPARSSRHKVVIVDEDPLGKYKDKVQAKSWGDFANKMARVPKKKLDPSLINAVFEENVKYTGKTGYSVELTKVKRPLSAIRATGNENPKSSFRLKYETVDIREKQKCPKDLSLDQVELLEKIGALIKCKTPYYPPTIEEVEYFVKNSSEIPYSQHYSTKDPSIESKVPQEIQDFGLSAYRSSIHLTSREECVVLLDWFNKMKAKYANEKQIETHKEKALRNLQLILSFAVGEIIRMSKIECTDRAIVLQKAWEQSVLLVKTLENWMTGSQAQIVRTWKSRFDEAKSNYERIISSLKEELRAKSAENAVLKMDLEAKGCALKNLESERNMYKNRAIALSGILDHLVAKNVADTKKYNKKQKRMMADLIKGLQKDREIFKKMAVPGTMATIEDDSKALAEMQELEKDLEDSEAEEVEEQLLNFNLKQQEEAKKTEVQTESKGTQTEQILVQEVEVEVNEDILRNIVLEQIGDFSDELKELGLGLSEEPHELAENNEDAVLLKTNSTVNPVMNEKQVKEVTKSKDKRKKEVGPAKVLDSPVEPSKEVVKERIEDDNKEKVEAVDKVNENLVIKKEAKSGFQKKPSKPKQENVKKVQKEAIPSKQTVESRSSPSFSEYIDKKAGDYNQLLKSLLETLVPREVQLQIYNSTLKLFKGASLSDLLSEDTIDSLSRTIEETKANPKILVKSGTEKPLRKPIIDKTPKAPGLLPLATLDNPIASSAASAMDDSLSEATDAHDTIAVRLDDPQTELPKKLMAAMSRMSEKISSLETDEYGEWLLDITKDSDLVNRIIKNGHLLTLLLRHLYKKKGEYATDTDIRLYDMGTQVEQIFTAESLRDTLREGKRMMNDKVVCDKYVQANIDGGRGYLEPYTPSVRHGVRYTYDEIRQLKANSFSIAKPFNIGKSTYGPAASPHPGLAFIATFIDKVERRDPKYLNVAPTTLRQLMKTITQLYGEKLNHGKDVLSIRFQPLAAFVYDSYINKYGLLNVAERKLKEVYLSVLLNKSRAHRAELFARFLGLSNVHYSADDLLFMFTVVQQLSYKAGNAAYVKQKAAVFELARQGCLEDFLETVEEIFGDKVDTKELAKLKEKVTEIAKEREEGIALKKDE